jgi:1-deoxyxylulose-5-phosphate synthase
MEGTMKTRSVGLSGLRVTSFGIGTASFGAGTSKEAAFEILDGAFEAGIRLIDTSDSYPSDPDLLGESERIIGLWLKSRDVRDEMVVATKVNYPMTAGLNSRGLSRKHMTTAVEDSLDRLQVDRIDLYQAHQVDRTTPVEETVRSFDALTQQGKVSYYGLCNWPAWAMATACGVADRLGISRPVSAQLPYNPVMREIEREAIPFCQDAGLGLLTINALAGGLLSGRYHYDQAPGPGRFDNDHMLSSGRNLGATYRNRYWTPQHFAAVDVLRQLCSSTTDEMVATTVAWGEQRQGVTSVLLGARTPEQLRAQLAGIERTLAAEVVDALDDLWWSMPRIRTW